MRHKLNEQCEQVKVVPFLYRCIGAANYNESRLQCNFSQKQLLRQNVRCATVKLQSLWVCPGRPRRPRPVQRATYTRRRLHDARRPHDTAPSSNTVEHTMLRQPPLSSQALQSGCMSRQRQRAKVSSTQKGNKHYFRFERNNGARKQWALWEKSLENQEASKSNHTNLICLLQKSEKVTFMG